MSLQVSDPISKCLGLSVGVALLLGNASAMASLQPYTMDVAQVDSSSTPPVVVDTVPAGRSTTDGPSRSTTVPAGRSTTGTSTGGSSRSTTVPTGRSTTGGSSIPVSDGETRFSCQSLNGQYTVMYQPESQPNQSFPWAIPATMGNGWTSARRCEEISQRLESYRPDGLVELRTDVENNYNTVCVTTENDPSCRIVFTVPPDQDPTLTRDRVFQNLTVADSGEETTAVSTYRNGGQQGNEVDELLNRGRAIFSGRKNPSGAESINLRPFLDRADGGTGTRLQGGVPNKTKSLLNPGSFR